MITILIFTEKLSMNEKVSSSIIGGFTGGITVISVTDFSEAEAVLLKGSHIVDLFILQVNMRAIGGYKAAERIRNIENYRSTPILFVTPLSYGMLGQHPLATYKSYEKQNFISAPVNRIDVQGKLGLYVDRILEHQRSSTEESILYFEYNGVQTFIPVKEIMYGEICNKQITLHCKKQRYTVKGMTLCELYETVGNKYFVRCHKSFLVNINQIMEIRQGGRRIWNAILSNDEACPISQTYYTDVRRKFIASRGERSESNYQKSKNQ